MVATLERLLVGETGLLEQVNHHVGSGKLSRGVEVDPDELSKTGGVVVPHSLGIAVSLQDGIGLHNLVLKGSLLLLSFLWLLSCNREVKYTLILKMK